MAEYLIVNRTTGAVWGPYEAHEADHRQAKLLEGGNVVTRVLVEPGVAYSPPTPSDRLHIA